MEPGLLLSPSLLGLLGRESAVASANLYAWQYAVEWGCPWSTQEACADFERAVAAHGLAPARPLRRRDLPPPWRDEEVLLIFEMRLRGRRGAGAGAGEEAEAAEGADEGGDAASR